MFLALNIPREHCLKFLGGLQNEEEEGLSAFPWGFV